MSDEVVKDTLVFQAPDGGEITMTMENYPDKEVERLKARLSENGWLFVGHDKDLVEKKVEEEGLNKLQLFLSGFLLGIIGNLVFQMWFSAGG